MNGNVWTLTQTQVESWSSFFSSAYQNNDITEFEKILKTNHSNIMDDPFIREHIEGESTPPWSTSYWMKNLRKVTDLIWSLFFFYIAELLRNIRTQVLIKLIKPYTRIHIPFISKVGLQNDDIRSWYFSL